jgi:hypothetical protein
MHNKAISRSSTFFVYVVIFFINNIAVVELPVEAFSRLPSIKSPKSFLDGSKISYLKNVENTDLTLFILI